MDNVISKQTGFINNTPLQVLKAANIYNSVEQSMDRSFTVVLSKGRYVVSEADAEVVLKSIEEQLPHVLVRADMLGDGLVMSPVRLVTSHIIAVVSNEPTGEPQGTLSLVR